MASIAQLELLQCLYLGDQKPWQDRADGYWSWDVGLGYEIIDYPPIVNLTDKVWQLYLSLSIYLSLSLYHSSAFFLYHC